MKTINIKFIESPPTEKIEFPILRGEETDLSDWGRVNDETSE